MTTITVPDAANADALAALAKDPATKFIQVEHSDETGDNLIQLSRKDPATKQAVTNLAKHGYYLYKQDGGASSFVRHNEIKYLWHRVKTGEYSVNDQGVIYTYTPPTLATDNPKMLVVFASIHEDMYSSGLMRYFKHNFPSVQKYVTPETGILRIADIGGVTGAFYLNTVAHPKNTARVQRLIEQVAADNKVIRDSIVFYGASKGATGALYHGMDMGIRCVVVDPIVSDEVYEKRYRDSHYTADGIFLERKQQLFDRLVKKVTADKDFAGLNARWAIICSDRSPQFDYINRTLIQPMWGGAAFFNSQHPDITDHPEVGPNTITMMTTLLNTQLYRMPVRSGIHKFI